MFRVTFFQVRTVHISEGGIVRMYCSSLESSKSPRRYLPSNMCSNLFIALVICSNSSQTIYREGDPFAEFCLQVFLGVSTYVCLSRKKNQFR